MQGSISRDNARIRLTSGIPRQTEGNDGDVVITRVNRDVRMYCKYKRNWHQVGSNFSLGNNSSIKSSFIKNPSVQGNLSLNNFRINKDGDNRKGMRFLDVAKNPKSIKTEFDAGQFDYSSASEIAFRFKSILTHATSVVGSDIFDLISGDITAKSVGGWNEVRLLHLAEKTVAGVTGKEFAFYTKENSLITHSVLQMNFDSDGYMQLKVADDGVTVIETVDNDAAAAHLTLDPDGDLIITTDHNTGQVTIDKDTTNTATATNKAMQIDFDHTGICASGQTITNIGLDLDINCESVTHVGNIIQTGIDLDMVAATDGAQYQTGMDIKVTGGDTNTGLRINTAGTHIKLLANADPVTDYATFTVADTGDLTIATVGDGTTDSDLTLDADGDITLDADGGIISFKDSIATFVSMTSQRTDFHYNVTNYFRIGVAANGETTLSTADSDGAVGHLLLSPDGSLIFNPVDGIYISQMNGTEFSATNSAYAGMILGYTCVGADAADDSYALTASYVCFPDSGGTEISVTFKTPPSENVEIEAELYFSAGSSNKQLRLSLSNNATYGSNTLAHPNQFEKIVSTPARGNGGTFTQKWWIQSGNLAAIGSSNTIFIAASTDSTSGTPTIKWGGDASNEYTNLVIKATALPATITEGS